jgi:hypothetical protein
MTTEGSVTDKSSLGLHGTPSNVTWARTYDGRFLNDYKDKFRFKEKIADFNGTTSYVEIPHNAAQLGANLGSGFTISAWINPRSAGEVGGGVGDGYIISKAAGSNGNLGFFAGYAGTAGSTRIAFRLNSGTTSVSGVTSFGTWQHILITISSAQLANFYVNGALSGTANQDLVQGISTITTTNAMRIGNRSGTTDRTFDGGIRSVKMWNKVFDATEIAQEYQGLINPAPANLIGWWDLSIPIPRLVGFTDEKIKEKKIEPPKIIEIDKLGIISSTGEKRFL